MANTMTRLAVAAVVFYLAAEGTAEAAKGVKKVAAGNGAANVAGNAPGNAAANAAGNVPGIAAGNVAANAGTNTQRTFSGVVMNVTQQNGGAALHLRTARHHKKRGVVNTAAVAGGNQQIHSHTVNMTRATRFTHQNGAPASVFSLHRGERVRVRVTGNQAMHVHILSQHRTRGSFARYRPNSYRPNLYHAHVRRRR